MRAHTCLRLMMLQKLGRASFYVYWRGKTKLTQWFDCQKSTTIKLKSLARSFGLITAEKSLLPASEPVDMLQCGDCGFQPWCKLLKTSTSTVRLPQVDRIQIYFRKCHTRKIRHLKINLCNLQTKIFRSHGPLMQHMLLTYITTSNQIPTMHSQGDERKGTSLLVNSWSPP